MFGLSKPNCKDDSSKSRYVQKLRRRLNYAFQKASKYSDQQVKKYKSSYDKSMKGPQLQEKDVVLVKIVAHKGGHELQDKWEPEEYVVVEQPIAGTPVYKVQPVTGSNIRTLHRNLLLPLGVKMEPDYKSDDSILEEDYSSSDESVVMVDSKSKIKGKKKSLTTSSVDNSQTKMKSEKFQSKKEKHVEFDSKLEISPDSTIKSDTVVSPDLNNVDVEGESIGENSHPNVEDSSDNVISTDVSLPSQFLLPVLDDSSCDEETEIRGLKTEAEINGTNQEEEMLSVNSEASSLVNTNEFLEFIDTMDMDDSENTKQSETVIESEQTVDSDQDPTEQTSVEPRSESQFSSFMSYHKGESSSLDPSTDEKELSKSPVNDSTQKTDSGADNHEDTSSHGNDIIAYESKESDSSSIDISSTNPVADVEIVTEDSISESTIEVEVMEPRRSARDRKQNFLAIHYCIEKLIM